MLLVLYNIVMLVVVYISNLLFVIDWIVELRKIDGVLYGLRLI